MHHSPTMLLLQYGGLTLYSVLKELRAIVSLMGAYPFACSRPNSPACLACSLGMLQKNASMPSLMDQLTVSAPGPSASVHGHRADSPSVFATHMRHARSLNSLLEQEALDGPVQVAVCCAYKWLIGTWLCVSRSSAEKDIFGSVFHTMGGRFAHKGDAASSMPCHFTTISTANALLYCLYADHCPCHCYSVLVSRSPMGPLQLPPTDTLRDLRTKKELLVEAATLFNEKPKKGIQFLQVRCTVIGWQCISFP